MQKTKITIIALMILAAVVRLYFFSKADNFEGAVTMGRVVNALNIIENPKSRLNFDGNTSVLYNYLLAAVLRFWPDVLVAPRVLSMLFGILIIIPFYLLIKLTFTEITALYSCIIVSLFPLHAIFSTFSMSDACFYFIFFSCLYFIFKFKLKEKRIIWLILSAALFNIAALLRFESWSFVPILPLLVLKQGKRYSLLFFCVSLIMPFLWMFLCYHFHEDAFYSFTASAKTAHMEILLHRVPYFSHIFGWLVVLYKTLGQGIVISGLMGIIYSFTKKRFFYLALFFLYLYFLYTVNAMAGRMWHNEKYSIFCALFLIPYSVLFFEKLSVFLRLKPVVLLLPFILLSVGTFKQIAVRQLRGHILPPEIKEIVGWLKDNASKSDKILIGGDRSNVYSHDIIVRSSIAPRNFITAPAFILPPSNIKNNILKYIKKDTPDYLILASTGYFDDLFSFDMRQKEIKSFGCIFKLVYSQDVLNVGAVNIYKIYY